MKKLNYSISAIILVGEKPDQELYKKCLNSVFWCTEVIKVETDKVPGSFADWRNFGAQKASGEWLLYIDTDEEIKDGLREEIKRVIKKTEFTAFAIPRTNFFLGQEMKHGGWHPDYVLRLIKKSSLVNWEGMLHEQPLIEGKVGKLRNFIVHRSHRDLSDMVKKTNKWSEIEAKLMFDANHPNMNLLRFLSAGFREFWYRGIEKSGYLDGPIGIIEIVYQTFSRLISYFKLWEMQVKSATKS